MRQANRFMRVGSHGLQGSIFLDCSGSTSLSPPFLAWGGRRKMRRIWRSRSSFVTEKQYTLPMICVGIDSGVYLRNRPCGWKYEIVKSISGETRVSIDRLVLHTLVNLVFDTVDTRLHCLIGSRAKVF